MTPARARWETQSATTLRVVSFQSAVVSESQHWPTEWHISTLIYATWCPSDRNPTPIFVAIDRFFDLSAYGDPARRVACFENGR